MKNFRYILSVFTILSALFLSSCSDDQKSDPIVFPELKEVNVDINEKGNLTFSVNGPWKLTSSAVWMKFIDGEFESNTISGKSGQNNVEFRITQDGAELDKTNIAQISITIGSEEKVIYKITRNALAYSLSATDINGVAIDEANPIILAFSGMTTFTVNANFKWAVTDSPEWVYFSSDKSSDPGIDFTMKIKIGENSVKDVVDGYLKITDQSGKNSFNLPVKYDGLPSDEIIIDLNDLSSAWGWSFSVDAKEFYRTNPSSNAIEKYDAPMSFNIFARNNDFEVISVEYNDKWGCTILNQYNKWFDVYNEEQNGSVKITCSANSSQTMREAFVLAVPRVVYESFGDDLDMALFDDIDGKFELKSEIISKFMVINFTQVAEVNNNVFEIMSDNQPMEFFSMADNIGEEETIKIYGTTKVWVVPVENRVYESIVIIPNNLNRFESVSADLHFNGNNTLWNQVEIEPNWTNEYYGLINVFGIKQGSSNGSQMIMRIVNGSTDETIGILVFEQ